MRLTSSQPHEVDNTGVQVGRHSLYEANPGLSPESLNASVCSCTEPPPTREGRVP